MIPRCISYLSYCAKEHSVSRSVKHPDICKTGVGHAGHGGEQCSHLGDLRSRGQKDKGAKDTHATWFKCVWDLTKGLSYMILGPKSTEDPRADFMSSWPAYCEEMTNQTTLPSSRSSRCSSPSSTPVPWISRWRGWEEMIMRRQNQDIYLGSHIRLFSWVRHTTAPETKIIRMVDQLYSTSPQEKLTGYLIWTKSMTRGDFWPKLWSEQLIPGGGHLLRSDLDTEVNERASNLLLDELEVGLLLLPVCQVVHQACHLVQQALRFHLGQRLFFSSHNHPKLTWSITLIGITRAYLENIAMQI